MRCFLACLGFSSSRRRRPTSAREFISADHHTHHGCYKPLELDSDSHHKHIHNPVPNPTLNRTGGEPLKKKVTFGGSTVTTYEPIEEDADCTRQVLIDKEEEKGDSFASQLNTYPPSYRYQNLTENWDEEEEDTIYEESDELLDDDYYDDIEESNEDDSDPMESEDDIETKRSRNYYMTPVLLPVENITQWRTLKAKHKRSATAKATVESKENIESETIDQNGHGEICHTHS